MSESVFKTLTDQTYELYQSFIASGFTEDQALELVKTQFAFAVANNYVNEKRQYPRRGRVSYYTETKGE